MLPIRKFHTFAGQLSHPLPIRKFHTFAGQLSHPLPIRKFHTFAGQSLPLTIKRNSQ